MLSPLLVFCRESETFATVIVLASEKRDGQFSRHIVQLDVQRKDTVIFCHRSFFRCGHTDDIGSVFGRLRTLLSTLVLESPRHVTTDRLDSICNGVRMAKLFGNIGSQSFLDDIGPLPVKVHRSRNVILNRLERDGVGDFQFIEILVLDLVRLLLCVTVESI